MLRGKILSLVMFVGSVIILPMLAACNGPGQKIDAVFWIGGASHDFEAAAEIVTEALKKRIPINVEIVRDAGFIDSADPQKLDVILMHHLYTSAVGVLDDNQKQRLQELVRQGVSIVALHASSHSFKDWPEYNEFFGASYIKHGPQEVISVLWLTDKQHPIAKGVADSFEVHSELYYHEPLAEDCQVIMMVKEKGGDHEEPAVWTRQYGRGRVVVITPSHWPTSYRVPEFQKVIANSTLWAAGSSDAVK